MTIRILLILLLLPPAATGQTVRLDSATTTPLVLSKQGFWLLDTTSSLTVREVASRPFLPIRQTNFRVPFSDYTYWYKCTLKNTVASKKQWYIEWQTPVAERVEFTTLSRMVRIGWRKQAPWFRNQPGSIPASPPTV